MENDDATGKATAEHLTKGEDILTGILAAAVAGAMVGVLIGILALTVFAVRCA